MGLSMESASIPEDGTPAQAAAPPPPRRRTSGDADTHTHWLRRWVSSGINLASSGGSSLSSALGGGAAGSRPVQQAPSPGALPRGSQAWTHNTAFLPDDVEEGV